jgi:hypothetical protein
MTTVEAPSRRLDSAHCGKGSAAQDAATIAPGVIIYNDTWRLSVPIDRATE